MKANPVRLSFFHHLHPPTIPTSQTRFRYTLGALGAFDPSQESSPNVQAFGENCLDCHLLSPRIAHAAPGSAGGSIPHPSGFLRA